MRITLGTSGPRSMALLAALPAALLSMVVLAWTAPPGSLDDVFVVLCDARAWLGGELEPGGGALSRPVVEGSTSPMDVGVKALILTLWPGPDPLRASGWVELGILFAIAGLTAWIVARFPVKGGARRPLARVTVGAAVVSVGVILAPGLAESAAFRLEGPLFALFWLGACAAAAEGRGRATLVWTFMLGITRPEGLLLAPVLGWIAGGTDRRAAVRLGLLALCIAGIVTGVRYMTFGELVPNTYFAKASDSRWQEVLDGAAYLARIAVTLAGTATIGLAIGVWILSSRVADGAVIRRLLVLAVVYLVVVIVSGGDGYTGARLAMPIGLAVWLAAGALWASVSGDGEAPPVTTMATRWLAVLAVAVQFVGALPQPWRGVRAALDSVVAAGTYGPTGFEAFAGDARVFAACVAALDGEVFAHRHVQRFRWFEPRAPVLDLTGLTDANVARRPDSGSVRFGRDALDLALEQRVGAIHIDAMRTRPAEFAGADTVRALADPDVASRFSGTPYVELELARELAEYYQPASFPLPEAGGYFNLLVRKGLAPRFRAAGFSVGER